MKELDEQEKTRKYILGEIGDEDRSAIEETHNDGRRLFSQSGEWLKKT